jgi:hypothetical protein
MLHTAARIVLLGAVAAPYAGLAQSPFEPVVKDERQRQIVEQIQEAQAADGPFSDALIGPLTALGLFYREGGDRVLAGGAIDQARQVVRVNYGLHSLEEVPLIRLAIENDEAIGDVTTAWSLERELLDLVARHPDDEQAVSILTQIGDKRMDLLRRYLSGEFPPQIVLGCYYRDRRFEDLYFADQREDQCTSGSRDNVRRSLLTEARSYYTKAIGTLIRSGGYSSPELPELEMRVIRNSYDASAYTEGRRSYRRLMSYQAANGQAWLDRVTTAIELADWDLQFAQHAGTIVLNGVLHIYTEARRLLEQKGVEQASIDELFTPKIPVMLPTFRPNPLASERTPESTGYIDVGFRITKYGRSQRVRVLDSTTNATTAAEQKLVHSIKAGRFRPRPTGDRYEDTVPVVVRYYVSE